MGPGTWAQLAAGEAWEGRGSRMAAGRLLEVSPHTDSTDRTARGRGYAGESLLGGRKANSLTVSA